MSPPVARVGLVTINVTIGPDLIDQILQIPDDIILTEFVTFIRRVTPASLISELRNGLEEPRGASNIHAEISLHVDPEADFFMKFTREAGDLLSDCLSLALEKVIRLINSDLPIEDMSAHLSRAELEDDEDYVEAHEDLTSCCLVEAFNDGFGNLLCPECGGFILNTAMGRSGCPSCGSGEVDEGGICQDCFSYAGPTNFGWSASNPESWF
jgi:hypothetical protein